MKYFCVWCSFTVETAVYVQAETIEEAAGKANEEFDPSDFSPELTFTPSEVTQAEYEAEMKE